MKIAQSSISMQANSQSAKAVFERKTTSVGIAFGTPQPVTNALTQDRQDKLTLSEQARRLSRELQNQRSSSTAQTVTDDDLRGWGYSEEDINTIHLIEKMTEALSGRKFKLNIPVPFRPDRHVQPVPQTRSAQRGTGQFLQIKIETQFVQETYESQSLEFQARGTVTTADGQTIDLSVSLNMSREFASKTQWSSSQTIGFGANTCDPLVVNYGGAAPELGERSFRFDLDCDGRSDQIAFLKKGSGFLALDKNGDGAINDGSELFGPQSGNGFADLAVYDGDGNNWIDENDAVYDRLRVWTVDANGERTLLALGQVGIGAIYLGSAQGDFSLNDGANQTLGNIRSTGIFLRENGGAGTIQHIDLAI